MTPRLSLSRNFYLDAFGHYKDNKLRVKNGSGRVSSNEFGRKIGKFFLSRKIFETLASSEIRGRLSDDIFIFHYSPLGGAMNWKKN